ncbi:acyl-CoA thioesterase [Thiorhodovibrio frisius]|uniref:Putative thioesterase n=1 Tax=Thiorhodovibrio frisius TaxID=631362 RepID=H8Z2X8_9GAMM|nr:thioesterase family protein [Thiorhodovibrio frisius]EIC22750.1 putative thioesterase [Thiorhodovibrio frisius]WPL22507.1 1,4-dihydroxy-2-naphthoyl-CoA hydrolase [Thiorhodovibrio frisius]
MPVSTQVQPDSSVGCEPFEYQFRVALHDTDAARRLFFGHLFRHLHDAYELWMEALGFPVDMLIREGEILLPLIHAEADYRAPMHHGERIRVQLALSQREATRFTLAYRCLNDSNKLAATGLTRHCCIDPKRQKPISLPKTLAQALECRAVHRTTTGDPFDER